MLSLCKKMSKQHDTAREGLRTNDTLCMVFRYDNVFTEGSGEDQKDLKSVFMTLSGPDDRTTQERREEGCRKWHDMAHRSRISSVCPINDFK